MYAWSRRRFLGATADTALLASLAGTLRPLSALADEAASTVTFYDPRFPVAQSLARELAGSAPLQSASADPSDLVLQIAATSRGPTALRLQGVTAESVPFCLAQLLPGACLSQRRVDQDLFVWTLESRS